MFADETVILGGTNSVALNQPTILGISTANTAAAGTTLTASIASVTDPDNVTSGGAITSVVDWAWQIELEPGGFFEPFTKRRRIGREYRPI